MAKAQAVAVAFGGVSAGIGAYYVAAPRHFLETIGMRPSRRRIITARAVGLQELAVASALAVDGRAARWLAVRVAGDVLHGGMLALGLRSRDNNHRQIVMTFGALLAFTAADVAAYIAASRAERTGAALEDGSDASSSAVREVADGAIHRAITIAREPSEVYAAWRDLDSLPQFMKHLERVYELDQTRSHWVARAPLGRTVEWDAEIVDDVPGERIAWRAADGAQIWSSGDVSFERAAGGRGTEVHVRLNYVPPGGVLGSTVARLLGEEPGNQISGDLRRFKQILETGEVVASEAVAEGRSRAQRPAQPIPVAA